MEPDEYSCGLCGTSLSMTDWVAVVVGHPGTRRARRRYFHPEHCPVGDPDMVVVTWATPLMQAVVESIRGADEGSS